MIEAVNGDLISSEVKMLLWMTDVLFSPPLLGGLPSPLRHGQNGILDEVLLFSAPIVVTLLILLISSRRARGNRERVRIHTASGITADAVETPDAGVPAEDDRVSDAPR
jgi:hypothetical protein